MRSIRYQVACSLDGYIAGPDDEYDWIVMDPDIDFAALFAQFDTLLMGRRTFEKAGGTFSGGMKTLVFSHTLRPEDHPGVTIVAEDIAETLDELRAQPGKDIWLFGGGELFRSLLELGYVDTVEPAIVPVVLGEGRPFLPSPAVRRRLSLREHRIYSKSGIALLSYDVLPGGNLPDGLPTQD
ncbi:MAG: dihydrofolate reductase family protein [Gemmatimonadota bacterium]|nr:dihydrofolate reductase family protein [Gemmatimonadota bacterium]